MSIMFSFIHGFSDKSTLFRILTKKIVSSTF